MMKTLIRLHQVLLVLAILSGCYAPELRDCTVSCGGGDTCAEGQVCTKGLCAAEGVSCTSDPPAMITDAGAGADATQRVFVRVLLSGGNGRVEIPGAGSCGDDGDRDCYISVVRGAVTANAVTTDTSHPFEKWESMTCMGQPATCSFMANMPTTIDAKFK